jgi:4-hydroxy-tetrahydrodipicolinate synthase
MEFTGLSAFAITPTDPSGSVKADDFGAIVDRICASGADSVGVLGSTGGFAYLDRDQRRRAIAIAVEASAGRSPIIAGIGALRSDAVVELAQDAAAAGASALLLPPVSYTPLSDDEVYALFATVEAATELLICIYHNPATTHFAFTTSLIERLAKLDKVRAIKQPPPTGQTIAEALAQLRQVTGGRLAIGYSGDPCLSEALHGGADCFFSSLGGILPDSFVALAAAAQTGSDEARAATEARFALLWDLLRKVGGLRLSFAIANRLGLTLTQPPLPLQPLGKPDLAALDAALAKLAD